eukprot:294504-Prorocentrum_minimum.AAC.1
MSCLVLYATDFQEAVSDFNSEMSGDVTELCERIPAFDQLNIKEIRTLVSQFSYVEFSIGE